MGGLGESGGGSEEFLHVVLFVEEDEVLEVVVVPDDAVAEELLDDVPLVGCAVLRVDHDRREGKTTSVAISLSQPTHAPLK